MNLGWHSPPPSCDVWLAATPQRARPSEKFSTKCYIPLGQHTDIYSNHASIVYTSIHSTHRVHTHTHTVKTHRLLHTHTHTMHTYMNAYIHTYIHTYSTYTNTVYTNELDNIRTH